MFYKHQSLGLSLEQLKKKENPENPMFFATGAGHRYWQEFRYYNYVFYIAVRRPKAETIRPSKNSSTVPLRQW